MLRRIYLGPNAVITGEKSQMARSAYIKQWDAQDIPLQTIAFAATLVGLVLTPFS